MERVMAWVKNNLRVSILALVGMMMVVVAGAWYGKTREPVQIEIIEGGSQILGETESKIWVDVQGEVIKPGVYELSFDARLKDAVLAAGGMGALADRNWVARYLNMAEKIKDGEKIYIPAEVSAGMTNNQLSISNDSSHSVVGFVNINTASETELDGLTGIGQTRAEAIIGGRPYGKIEELVSKKILPQSVFDKIKDKISVY